MHRYALRDDQWDKIKDFLPGREGHVGGTATDNRLFVDAGFEWRAPGCSLCVAMNGDRLLPGDRCVSTSNRNFEGRQGRGGRTHLVSPAVAAATAVAGHFATPEDLS